MDSTTGPVYGHGKVCYIEIPANDITLSADFFSKVFNWKIRTSNEGHTSFDDGVGGVSGMWVLDRKPSTEAGLLTSIMVDDAEATIKAIVTNGGIITQPIGMDAPEITAHFTDPAGNIWGIYQHRG